VPCGFLLTGPLEQQLPPRSTGSVLRAFLDTPDGPVELSGSPQRLNRERYRCLERLESQAAAGWELWLSDGTSLQAAQVVLAAGAHCRQLWPALPQRLRSSWAAALQLASFPAPCFATTRCDS
jgi:hypothetical protein